MNVLRMIFQTTLELFSFSVLFSNTILQSYLLSILGILCPVHETNVRETSLHLIHHFKYFIFSLYGNLMHIRSWLLHRRMKSFTADNRFIPPPPPTHPTLANIARMSTQTFRIQPRKNIVHWTAYWHGILPSLLGLEGSEILWWWYHAD